VPNTTLGETSKQEIRAAMENLSGSQARFQAARLADAYGCSISTIYAASAELRPRRKPRSDKGARKATLDHPVLRYAAERVVTRNYDPELALMEAEHNVGPLPVSLGTFRRLLRENGITASDNARNVTPHRNFSAAPGDIYQLDLSAVKTRWLDIRTRNILKLDITPNHPNINSNLIPIWKIAIIDDGSRFRLVDFIAVPKPTSNDVVDFVLRAFREMGVPKFLYSDNDSIIKGRRMRRAERILNEAFKDTGGFALTQHLPYNAKATGKVERTHKVIEKFEKLIGGLYEQPTLESLKDFTARVCQHLNWKEHRTTGEKPALRFRQAGLMRVPPSALLDAAFKADEFTNKPINANVTITIEGAHYQLPRSSDYPFFNLAGTKARVTVVWPPDVDWFGVLTPDGGDYTIEKKLWQEDAAGEFKSLPETKRQCANKSLRQSEAARRKAHKEAGTQPAVPFFHFTPDAQPGSITIMPRPQEEMSAEQLADLAPGAVPPLPYSVLTYITAVELLQDGDVLSNPLSDPDKAWIKGVFNGRTEIGCDELRDAIYTREAEQAVAATRRRA
jgi:hypothetical protein